MVVPFEGSDSCPGVSEFFTSVSFSSTLPLIKTNYLIFSGPIYNCKEFHKPYVLCSRAVTEFCSPVSCSSPLPLPLSFLFGDCIPFISASVCNECKQR